MPFNIPHYLQFLVDSQPENSSIHLSTLLTLGIMDINDPNNSDDNLSDTNTLTEDAPISPPTPAIPPDISLNQPAPTTTTTIETGTTLKNTHILSQQREYAIMYDLLKSEHDISKQELFKILEETTIDVLERQINEYQTNNKFLSQRDINAYLTHTDNLDLLDKEIKALLIYIQQVIIRNILTIHNRPLPQRASTLEHHKQLSTTSKLVIVAKDAIRDIEKICNTIHEHSLSLNMTTSLLQIFTDIRTQAKILINELHDKLRTTLIHWNQFSKVMEYIKFSQEQRFTRQKEKIIAGTEPIPNIFYNDFEVFEQKQKGELNKQPILSLETENQDFMQKVTQSSIEGEYNENQNEDFLLISKILGERLQHFENHKEAIDAILAHFDVSPDLSDDAKMTQLSMIAEEVNTNEILRKDLYDYFDSINNEHYTTASQSFDDLSKLITTPEREADHTKFFTPEAPSFSTDQYSYSLCTPIHPTGEKIATNPSSLMQPTSEDVSKKHVSFMNPISSAQTAESPLDQSSQAQHGASSLLMSTNIQQGQNQLNTPFRNTGDPPNRRILGSEYKPNFALHTLKTRTSLASLSSKQKTPIHTRPDSPMIGSHVNENPQSQNPSLQGGNIQNQYKYSNTNPWSHSNFKIHSTIMTPSIHDHTQTHQSRIPTPQGHGQYHQYNYEYSSTSNPQHSGNTNIGSGQSMPSGYGYSSASTSNPQHSGNTNIGSGQSMPSGHGYPSASASNPHYSNNPGTGTRHNTSSSSRHSTSSSMHNPQYSGGHPHSSNQTSGNFFPYSSAMNPETINVKIKNIKHKLTLVTRKLEEAKFDLCDLTENTESDKTVERREIMKYIDIVQDKMRNLMDASSELMRLKDEVENLPSDQNLRASVDSTHSAVEETYKKSQLEIKRLREKVRSREICRNSLDIQDTAKLVTFPTFDGSTDINSLNVYEYIDEAENFFRKRQTLPHNMVEFLKEGLTGTPEAALKMKLKPMTKYSEVKEAIINRYGKVPAICEQLFSDHDKVKQLHSTLGDKVDWNDISAKTKNHIRLLTRAEITNNSVEEHKKFIHTSIYLSCIRKYLPIEYRMKLIGKDVSFDEIKEMYMEIERIAENFQKTAQHSRKTDTTRDNVLITQPDDSQEKSQKPYTPRPESQKPIIGTSDNCKFCAHNAANGHLENTYEKHLLKIRSTSHLYGCPLYAKQTIQSRLDFYTGAGLCVYCATPKDSNHKTNRCRSDNMRNKTMRHTCMVPNCPYRFELCKAHINENKPRLEFIMRLWNASGAKHDQEEMILLTYSDCSSSSGHTVSERQLAEEMALLTVNVQTQRLDINNLNVVEDSRGANIPILDLPSRSPEQKVQEFLQDNSSSHRIVDVTESEPNILHSQSQENRPLLMDREEIEKIHSDSRANIPVFIMTKIQGQHRGLTVLFDSGATTSVVRSDIPGIQLKGTSYDQDVIMKGVGNSSRRANKWTIVLKKRDGTEYTIDALSTSTICNIGMRFNLSPILTEIKGKANMDLNINPGLNEEIQNAKIYEDLIGSLDLLIGMRDKVLFPIEILTLPCGLSLYKNVLKTMDDDIQYSIGGSYSMINAILTSMGTDDMSLLIDEMSHQINKFRNLMFESTESLKAEHALMVNEEDGGFSSAIQALQIKKDYLSMEHNMSNANHDCKKDSGNIPALMNSSISTQNSSDLDDFYSDNCNNNMCHHDYKNETLEEKSIDSNTTESSSPSNNYFQGCKTCTKNIENHDNDDQSDLDNLGLVILPRPVTSRITNTMSHVLRCNTCDEVATQNEYCLFIQQHGILFSQAGEDSTSEIILSVQEPEIIEQVDDQRQTNKKLYNDIMKIMDPIDPYYKCQKCSECTDCKAMENIAQISLRHAKEERLIGEGLRYDRPNESFFSSLPQVIDIDQSLANNYEDALKRYQRECYKAKRDPEIKKVLTSTMDKMFANGYIKKVADLPTEIQHEIKNKKCYYMPYSVVHKETSFTSKTRVVFDASSKTKSGLSLNDCLAGGISVLDMEKPLTNFVAHKHAIQSDLKQFYCSIKLEPKDYRFQLILYDESLSPNMKPELYAVVVIIYGVRPSSRILEQAVDRVITDIPHEPLIQEFLTKRFVDDLFLSKDHLESTEMIRSRSSAILKKYNFKPKYFVLSREPPPKEATEDGIVHVAGYRWNPQTDELSIKPIVLFFAKKIKGKISSRILTNADSIAAVDDFTPQELTLRMITSRVASIYDPFHFNLVYSTMLKHEVRKVIISLQSQWDDSVSSQVRQHWVKIFYEMMSLASWHKRNPIPLSLNRIKTYLAIFTDSGQRAKAQVAYLIHVVDNHTRIVQFLRGKSQLSDDKSVPCAELDSLEKGVKLANKIKSDMDSIEDIYYFTDSAVILFWLINHQLGLSKYNRKRITTILSRASVNQFFKVPTHMNPSDYPTKPSDDLAQTLPNSPYLSGPKFLENSMEENINCGVISPAEQVVFDEETKHEARPGFIKDTALIATTDNELSALEKRYSFSEYLVDPLRRRWISTINVLGYIIIFIYRCLLARARLNPPGKKKDKYLNLCNSIMKREMILPGSKLAYSKELLLTSQEDTLDDTLVENTKTFDINIEWSICKLSPTIINTLFSTNNNKLSFNLFRRHKVNLLKIRIPNTKIVEVLDKVRRISQYYIEVSGIRLKDDNSEENVYKKDTKILHLISTQPVKKILKKIQMQICSALFKMTDVIIETSILPQEFTFPIGDPIQYFDGLNDILKNQELINSLRKLSIKFKVVPNEVEIVNKIDISHIVNNLSSEILVSDNKKIEISELFVSVQEYENVRQAAIIHLLEKSTKEVEHFYDKKFVDKHSLKIGKLRYGRMRLVQSTQILAELGNTNGVIDLHIPEYIPVVDGRSPVGLSILRHIHEKYNHAGVSITRLQSLRGVYAFRVNEAISRIINTCLTCRIKNRKLLQVSLGPIPKLLHYNSVNFCVFGDMSGPYSVRTSNLKDTRNSNRTIEVMCLHIICSMSYLTSLTIVEPGPKGGADADTFVEALHRISSLLGMPTILIMDNSTVQIKAANKDHYLVDSKFQIYKKTGIDIRLCGSTPQSHYRIGKAERNVGMVKNYLKTKKFEISNATVMQFETALKTTAAALNSIPIASNPRYGIANESRFITPYHFLNGRRGIERIPLPPSDIDPETSNEYLEKISAITDGMMDYFSRRLPDLLLRPARYEDSKEPPKLNDIVMIPKDGSEKVGQKQFIHGVVTGLEFDADEKIRIVEVTYSNANEICYPLRRNEKAAPNVIKRTTRRAVCTVSIIYSIDDKRIDQNMKDLFDKLRSNSDCTLEEQALLCYLNNKNNFENNQSVISTYP